MHQGTRCRPGDASEFAVRKEGKEEHEEFLRGDHQRAVFYVQGGRVLDVGVP
jgi:hypothetical protein